MQLNFTSAIPVRFNLPNLIELRAHQIAHTPLGTQTQMHTHRRAGGKVEKHCFAIKMYTNFVEIIDLYGNAFHFAGISNSFPVLSRLSNQIQMMSH